MKERRLEKVYNDEFNKILEKNIGKGVIKTISRVISIISPIITFGGGAYVAIASVNLTSSKKYADKKIKTRKRKMKTLDHNFENTPRSKFIICYFFAQMVIYATIFICRLNY